MKMRLKILSPLSGLNRIQLSRSIRLKITTLLTCRSHHSLLLLTRTSSQPKEVASYTTTTTTKRQQPWLYKKNRTMLPTDSKRAALFLNLLRMNSSAANHKIAIKIPQCVCLKLSIALPAWIRILQLLLRCNTRRGARHRRWQLYKMFTWKICCSRAFQCRTITVYRRSILCKLSGFFQNSKVNHPLEAKAQISWTGRNRRNTLASKKLLKTVPKRVLLISRQRNTLILATIKLCKYFLCAPTD